MERESHDDAFLEDLAGLNAAADPSWVAVVVANKSFHYAVTFLILANVAAMVKQADHPNLFYPAGCGKADFDGDVIFEESANCVYVWRVVDELFLVLFAAELALRMLAAPSFRSFFVRGKDYAWNRFDFITVALNVLEAISCYIVSGSGPVGRLIHGMRMLRVLRVMRLLRHFSKLRVLVAGLFDSARYVFWTVMLAVTLIFIFAIMCTMMVGHFDQDFDEEDRPRIQWYFGTVEKSMFTLFQFLTLDDWRSVLTMVNRGMPVMTPFLFLYVIIMSFIMVSLFTGSMVNHMSELNRSSEAAEGAEFYVPEEDFSKALQETFPMGVLNRQQFLAVFQHAALRRHLYIDDIQFTPEEAIAVFEYFDRDNDGVVSVKEFKQSCFDYRDGLTIKTVLRCKSNFMKILRDIGTDEGEGRVWYRNWIADAWAQPPDVQRDINNAADRMKHVEADLTLCEHQVTEVERLTLQLYSGHTLERAGSFLRFRNRVCLGLC